MVYYNPFKQTIRAFIRALRVFISSLFSKRLLLMIIVALFIILLHLNVNAVTYTDSIEDELTSRQENNQNDFILEILPHYLDNDLEWQNIIKPIFDDILDNNKSIHVTDMGPDGSNITFNVQDVYTYYWQSWFSDLSKSEYVNRDVRSNLTGQNQSIQHVHFKGNVTVGSQYYLNIIRFYMNNNTHNIDHITTTINTYGYVPLIIADYKSTLMIDFLTYYEGWKVGSSSGQINYTSLLNDIESYCSSIDSNTSNINSKLSNILSILNTIANKTDNDYTQQISSISSQMSDLLDKEEEVADNTEEMIQQQEEIKEGINDLNDFLSDDTVDNSSIIDNMPTNDEFQDVTQSGFDNIFTTLRNAFTSDNYQDVEFVVPFSNGQKITIPSNLTENIIPTAIKTLIQMVYWYFIARFIVKDIASYIEKAKSGDIFSSSDTNIKTDML